MSGELSHIAYPPADRYNTGTRMEHLGLSFYTAQQTLMLAFPSQYDDTAEMASNSENICYKCSNRVGNQRSARYHYKNLDGEYVLVHVCQSCNRYILPSILSVAHCIICCKKAVPRFTYTVNYLDMPYSCYRLYCSDMCFARCVNLLTMDNGDRAIGYSCENPGCNAIRRVPKMCRKCGIVAYCSEKCKSENSANHDYTCSKIRVCDSCNVPAENMQKCGACKRACYCSKNCQKRDWPMHKTSCKKHGR